MMQSNKKIAITGGIGSGKSTVAKIIANSGFPIISCDEIYGKLLHDKEFLDILSEQFEGIVTSEGKLDRKKLSSIVFNNKESLLKLNNITHPRIMAEAFRQMQGDRLYFCEVPLLFECGYENSFDNVIVVLRDKEKRISDIVKRDRRSEAEAKLLIDNQFDYDKNLFEKYYVLHNNGNINDLRNEVLNLLKVFEK